MTAVRTGRTAEHQTRRLGLVDFRKSENLTGLLTPGPLQPDRKTQNHHIQKTADQQTKAEGQGNQQGRIGLQHHQHQMAAASLNTGRYMPMTMEPTTPPMTIITIGSIRLDRASTALLTSCS